MYLVHRRWRIPALAIMVAVLVTVAALLVSNARKSEASDVSYVWNDYAGQVAVYGVPSTDSYADHLAPNGTRFAMECWLDNQNERWFRGVIYDTGGVVYVEANWVAEQTEVGSC